MKSETAEMSENQPDESISQAAQFYNEDIRKVEQQIAQSLLHHRPQTLTIERARVFIITCVTFGLCDSCNSWSYSLQSSCVLRA